MSNNALARIANSIPVRWGYFTKNRLAQKVIFIGHEKAIYDADGTRLDSKLSSIEDSISDAFSEGKAYAVGDYCIYLNALYKFTAAKPAGAWDGSKVVPISLSSELGQLNAKTVIYRGNLPSNANVNDYITDGVWSISSWFAQSLINIPNKTTSQFIVRASGTYVTQTQIMINGDTYVRFRSNEGEWSNWVRNATVGPSGGTFDYMVFYSNAADLNNPPKAFILQSAPNPAGFPSKLGGNSCIVLQLFPGRADYSAQLAFGFGSEYLAFRRKQAGHNGGEWTNWNYTQFDIAN